LRTKGLSRWIVRRSATTLLAAKRRQAVRQLLPELPFGVGNALQSPAGSGPVEDQIKNNLLFSGEKVGDMMTIAMRPADAKAWFGAVPPDLSVITRARASGAGSGADYLYTYLRTFYKDDTRPTGWNNMVVPNVAMPHVLWQLQGVRTAKMVEEEDPHEHGKKVHKFAGFEQVSKGQLSSQEFDTQVADLVAYMNWMAEPAQDLRKRLGAIVLLFLAVFAFLAWRLNASYWKDVK
jgi:ubiquinol-cytochrome c reductase cytochrome c1 subunit